MERPGEGESARRRAAVSWLLWWVGLPAVVVAAAVWWAGWGADAAAQRHALEELGWDQAAVVDHPQWVDALEEVRRRDGAVQAVYRYDGASVGVFVDHGVVALAADEPLEVQSAQLGAGTDADSGVRPGVTALSTREGSDRVRVTECPTAAAHCTTVAVDEDGPARRATPGSLGQLPQEGSVPVPHVDRGALQARGSAAAAVAAELLLLDRASDPPDPLGLGELADGQPPQRSWWDPPRWVVGSRGGPVDVDCYAVADVTPVSVRLHEVGCVSERGLPDWTRRGEAADQWGLHAEWPGDPDAPVAVLVESLDDW